MSGKSGFKLKLNFGKATASSSQIGQKRKASDSSPLVEESSKAGDKKQKIKTYREVREGHGGTFTMTQEPHHIGTHTLLTCLGIYFTIDADRCFFAHVNFQVMGPDGRKRMPPLLEYYRIESHELRKAVRITMGQALDQARTEGGWNVNQRMRDTLVMASPFCRGPHTMMADVLAQAVRRFLRIPEANRGNAEYAIVKQPDPMAMIVHHNGPNQGDRFANVQFWSGVNSTPANDGWIGELDPPGPLQLPNNQYSFSSGECIREDGMTTDGSGVWEFEDSDFNDSDDEIWSP